MQIIVSGKQVDVGDSLRSHIENRLSEGIPKYLDRVTSVNVVISRESHMFRVDITGNPGTHAHIVIRGRDEAGDPYAAFDGAAQKIEKQLRRYKRRLTDHHKRTERANGKMVTARKFVLAPEQEDELKSEASPVIVAEKPTSIETLTVGEAVMKMDLEDLPAVLFFNSAHGRINVVYRRADGNISWVDPEGQAA